MVFWPLSVCGLLSRMRRNGENIQHAVGTDHGLAWTHGAHQIVLDSGLEKASKSISYRNGRQHQSIGLPSTRFYSLPS